MKKVIILLIFIFVFHNSIGQEIVQNYIFNVELSTLSEKPSFEKMRDEFLYKGDNSQEKAFFSKYKIIDFFQSYPSSQRERTLKIFTFITVNQSLMEDLLTTFPLKYIRAEDLTEIKVNLDFNTNDYGSTSSVPNMGIAASMKNFDYINVPKAWDYTLGSSDVKMGWSDAKVDTTDLDFKFKTSFLQPYYNAGYQNLPFSNEINSWHGSQTAAIGGAQGDNAHGLVGVCSNCEIVATSYGYGSPGSVTNPTPNFNNLLQLALSGVKVINMSWGSLSPSSGITSHQWIIDEIHDMGIVLVASAGNQNSYVPLYAPNYLVYNYPASYNNVISVTSVNFRNANIGDEVTNESYGRVSWNVEDHISPTGVMGQNGVFYTPYYEGHTTNEKVDICAPGWRLFRYDQFIGNGSYLYNGNGTSGAAPHVTGTVGLMFSLNNCLTPDEVEDILQLTTKNIESNQYNAYFLGRIGSGKLETGDAVEFTSEMMDKYGNALISGQDFYRFNFDLQHINNNLIINNQIFRDKNTSNFVAKNSIEILENSDLKPNEFGFIDLKVDENIDISCSEITSSKQSNNKEKKTSVNSFISKLFPNPNTGNFTIIVENEDVKDISITIYNILGKPVFQATNIPNWYEVKLPSLASGLYFVKLYGANYNETLKFIKN